MARPVPRLRRTRIQKSIWAGMDWTDRDWEVDWCLGLLLIIKSVNCAIRPPGQWPLTGSRFNFPISPEFAKIPESIWIIITRWFQWECLLAFGLIAGWCVWPTLAWSSLGAEFRWWTAWTLWTLGMTWMDQVVKMFIEAAASWHSCSNWILSGARQRAGSW